MNPKAPAGQQETVPAATGPRRSSRDLLALSAAVLREEAATDPARREVLEQLARLVESARRCAAVDLSLSGLALQRAFEVRLRNAADAMEGHALFGRPVALERVVRRCMELVSKGGHFYGAVGAWHLLPDAWHEVPRFLDSQLVDFLDTLVKRKRKGGLPAYLRDHRIIENLRTQNLEGTDEPLLDVATSRSLAQVFPPRIKWGRAPASVALAIVRALLVFAGWSPETADNALSSTKKKLLAERRGAKGGRPVT